MVAFEVISDIQGADLVRIILRDKFKNMLLTIGQCDVNQIPIGEAIGWIAVSDAGLDGGAELGSGGVQLPAISKAAIDIGLR